MSISNHPVAYRLEQQVGGATKLLATVMWLPLIDGIFPALVLAGALDTSMGILQVGLLVFGGSATLSVILAEMGTDKRRNMRSVLAVGIVLIVVAALEAAMAPTIRSVLDLATFERFAALVMLAVAAKTASSTVGEYLPSPAVIIGLGMVASFDPSGAQLSLVFDETLIVKAVAAAVVGAGFALAVVQLGSMLRGLLDIDRFRFGSAIALGVLPFSVLKVLPGNAPLVVLAVTSLLALNPGASTAEELSARADAATDGGVESVEESASESRRTVEEIAYGYPEERDSDERKPWL